VTASSWRATRVTSATSIVPHDSPWHAGCALLPARSHNMAVEGNGGGSHVNTMIEKGQRK